MSTLLVVDDEPDIRDLVVRRLVRDGHAVIAAEDGPSAVALVHRQGPPDAAILDIDMPGMDGFDLLERLRKVRPGLPVLLLSVLWDVHVHARIRDLEVLYVAKPFTARELSIGVERLLHRGPNGGAARGSER